MELADAYRGKTVLVTGDTGFKGSWLTIWLRELGAEVIGLALPPASPEDNFVACGLADRSAHIDGDVRDPALVAAVVARHKPELVFHLAAQSLVLESYRDPRGTFETNIMGTVNVLDAIRSAGSVRAAVIVTSDKCYAPVAASSPYVEAAAMGGDDPYSASKGAAELVTAAMRSSYFAATSAAAVATARAGNVVGGGDWARDRIIPDCMRALTRGDEIVLRRPTAVRPWQHVLDALHGYLRLAARLLGDDRSFATGWNFGPAVHAVVSVRELVEALIARWGTGGYRIAQDPGAPAETERLQLDSTRARTRLGWQPVLDLPELVGFTVDGYRAEPAEPAVVYAHRVAQIRAFEERARG